MIEALTQATIELMAANPSNAGYRTYGPRTTFLLPRHAAPAQARSRSPVLLFHDSKTRRIPGYARTELIANGPGADALMTKIGLAA